MSNESEILHQRRLSRRPSSAKRSHPVISIETSVADTHHSTKHSGVPHAPCRRHSKYTGKRSVTMGHKIFNPPSYYHSWNTEYSQLFIREKTQKSMTKDSYQLPLPAFEQVKESLTTEEECCPKLISFNTVHIEKPTIHYRRKPILPTIVRHLRSNELLPSERFKPLPPPPPPLPVKSSIQIPIINTPRMNNILPTLTVNERLLNRSRMCEDASIVIRRPPRRLTITTFYPLTLHS
ncbi:hypothetical protein I4U23_023836 [Adineta vaga]|nr:hypothetical protein I4U23_023836 [Adineta vaga]